jgi:hypothetical protein
MYKMDRNLEGGGEKKRRRDTKMCGKKTVAKIAQNMNRKEYC